MSPDVHVRPAARRLAPAGGLIAGYALDRLLGDPARWHPVAGFGLAAGRLEQRLYADDRRRGVAFTGLAVGVPVAAGCCSNAPAAGIRCSPAC